MSDIKRGSGVAVWKQIARELEHTIARGQMAEGERLPTEMELAERFRVNRHTVRRAIAELANDGHVKAVRGRGTFVAEKRISYPLTARTRFSEIVAAQDLAPGGRIISARTEPAESHVAARLEIEKRANVLRLETLRVANGHPVAVGTSWLEAEKVPNFLLDYAELGSMSAALERAGFGAYKRKSSWITAAAADITDASHLRLQQGAPLLVVESLNVTDEGKPLQFARARFAPGTIQLVIDS